MLELYDFPDEILVEILSRSPIKTLMICTCTSKWLHSFISTPQFMTAHINKTAQNPLIFLKYYTGSTLKEYFSLKPDDDSFDGKFDITDMPIRLRPYGGNRWFDVLGSVNGVICLSIGSGGVRDIILWNPCIRKLVMVPGCDHRERCGWVSMDFGFGFDSRKDDFKVVRLIYTTDKSGYATNLVVDVYSLQSKLWRVIEGPGTEYLVSRSGNAQCFLNGTIHWPGWSGCVTARYCIIACNVEDEVFVEIKVPDSLADGDNGLFLELRVGKCIDKLALLKLNSGGKVWSVWVMREYGLVDSWSKVFNVDLHCENLKPAVFSFIKNEEILILLSDSDRDRDRDRDSKHLMLLVGRNGLVSRVFRRINGVQGSFWLGTYVESLALFKELPETVSYFHC